MRPQHFVGRPDGAHGQRGAGVHGLQDFRFCRQAHNANAGNAAHGVFTGRPGTLSKDFFVNLLDVSTQWTRSSSSEGIYEGRDPRALGRLRLTVARDVCQPLKTPLAGVEASTQWAAAYFTPPLFLGRGSCCTRRPARDSRSGASRNAFVHQDSFASSAVWTPCAPGTRSRSLRIKAYTRNRSAFRRGRPAGYRSMLRARPAVSTISAATWTRWKTPLWSNGTMIVTAIESTA